MAWVYLILALISMSDETLILFLIISPPAWLAESHWFIVRFTHPSNIPIPVAILAGMIFWGIVGLLIDSLIIVVKRQKRD